MDENSCGGGGPGIGGGRGEGELWGGGGISVIIRTINNYFFKNKSANTVKRSMLQGALLDLAGWMPGWRG